VADRAVSEIAAGSSAIDAYSDDARPQHTPDVESVPQALHKSVSSGGGQTRSEGCSGESRWTSMRYGKYGRQQAVVN